MATRDERMAAELLDEYCDAALAGREPDLETLLRRCPASEREDLLLAIQGTQFAMRNYEGILAPPAQVHKALAAIRAAQERQGQVREAYGRLREQPLPELLRADNIPALLKRLLDIELKPEQFMPRMRTTAEAVMYRGRQARASTGEALQRARLETAAGQASRHAQRLWTEFGCPEPPVDPKDIAEQLGLVVIEHKTEGCDGCVLMKGDVGGIVVNAAIRHEGRRRFTVAHELGHFELHRSWLPFVQESLRDIECASTDESEVEANAFASALLMPADLVEAEFAHQEPSFQAIDTLAQRYVVSKTAAARRLVRISDFACAVLYIVGGKVRWFEKSEEFPYFLAVGGPPPRHSDAAALVAGETVRDSYWATPAAWWAPEDRRAEDAELMEHSQLVYDDQVLALLYARDVSA